MKYRRSTKQIAVRDLQVGDLWETQMAGFTTGAYMKVTGIEPYGNGDVRVSWTCVGGRRERLHADSGYYVLDGNAIRWLVEIEPSREASHYPCLDSDCECIWDNF